MNERILETTQDMTGSVVQALMNCDDGAVIQFEPVDEIHFYPDGAFEKYYYISNNQHGLKCVAFPIIGKRNITIDGGGARFIFHGELMPFVVEDSANITLKNFSIDWERPFYSQGVVTDADTSSVTVAIDRKRYPYRFENGEILFEGEGWTSGFSEGVFEMDPSTGGPAYLSGDAMGAGIKSCWNVEEVADGIIRIHDNFKQPAKVGNVLLLRHYERLCPGIHLLRSQDILLEEVVLNHAGGMGVIGQFCENVTVRKCSVTPSGDRLFSVTVDATHFVNCRGQITLENCLFENQLDDPCNVHGINTRIKEVVDPRTVIVELVHHEQHGVEVGFPGDRMQISDNVTLLPYAEGTVELIERIDERYSKVVMRDVLPDGIRTGHVFENMSWVSDLHVVDCQARNNRARGYLISTHGKVVIENNRIESSGAAIKISGDANYWFESGAVRDVLIRNNEFGDCCYGCSVWGRAVIDIDPEIEKPLDNPKCFHRGIRIEGNRFATFDNGILFARSVDGLVFCGNTITRTETYTPTGRMDAALTFEGCDHVDVSGNNWGGASHSEWVREISRNKVLV